MCRKDAGWSCIWYAAFVLIRESRFYVHPICLLQTVARRRYLGCVLCSLTYRYAEVQAKACLQPDIQVLGVGTQFQKERTKKGTLRVTSKRLCFFQKHFNP